MTPLHHDEGSKQEKQEKQEKLKLTEKIYWVIKLNPKINLSWRTKI